MGAGDEGRFEGSGKTRGACTVDARAGAELERKAEDVASAKAGQPVLATLALGFLAGLFIGLGALLMLFVKSDASLSFAPAQLLGGLSFSLGLLLVVVAGAELFTGNALMVCAAASGRIPWRAMLRNWALVWPANLAGALFLVFLVYMADAASMNGGAAYNILIATAGNIVGGALVVGCVYWLALHRDAKRG